MGNDKIKLGFVGLAGRGFHAHIEPLSAFPDVEITAVCDVYEPNVKRAVDFTAGQAKGYSDFRKLVEDPNVDAVFVSTPPHWHALVSIAALEAGKDVYCEKPLCLFPAEMHAMAAAAKTHKRITQDGTQVHASENYRRCVDIVRSGILGQITQVSNFCTMNDNSEGIGNPPDEAVPAGLDWDMWSGPAAVKPFNVRRFTDGTHRYFVDYVQSWLNELGPHIMELPFWALDLASPQAVSASGGRYATTSIADVPDTLSAIWEYPNMVMSWSLLQSNSFHFGVGNPGPGRHNGIIFHGKAGNLAIVNYGTPVATDSAGQVIDLSEVPSTTPSSPGHHREFIDSVTSRVECSCSFEAHTPLYVATTLAHLSLKLGRKLHWDDQKWEVTGDIEATEMLTPQYRAPWKLPVG